MKQTTKLNTHTKTEVNHWHIEYLGHDFIAQGKIPHLCSANNSRTQN